MRVEAQEAETIAGFSMAIVAAEPSPEAEQGWTQRAEVLAAWLAAQWRREQGRLEEGVVAKCDPN